MSIKIGGVPEHYNAPFHTALAAYADPENFEFAWTDFPSGTGAMIDALSAGEIDLAVLLTEGIVKRIIEKNDMRIVGTFTNNPLPWGVHVRAGAFGDLIDFNKKVGELVFGISRLGSGSHLMALVHAKSIGVAAPQFRVVNTMAGAAEAMTKGEIDAFLWDVTTADVHAKAGVWKCIGTLAGSWPAFVFAVRADASTSALHAMVRFLHQVRHHGMILKDEPEFTTSFLQERYRISAEQATQFLASVSWNSSPTVSQAALERAAAALTEAAIVSGSQPVEEMILSSFCSLVK